MHNGYITDFHAVGRQMTNLMNAETYSHITGRTDSEMIAALYMSYLTAGQGTQEKTADGAFEAWEKVYTTQEMFEALQNAVNTIIELQKVALGDKRTPNDLNICVTDGRQLVACRFRNHATEQPPSLYWSTTAGVTLNRKFPDHPDGAESQHGKETRDVKGTHGRSVEGHNPYMTNENVDDHGKHVIVASEPSTYKIEEWKLVEKNHAILVEADGTESWRELKYEV